MVAIIAFRNNVKPEIYFAVRKNYHTESIVDGCWMFGDLPDKQPTTINHSISSSVRSVHW
jgi:hypothetical protein